MTTTTTKTSSITDIAKAVRADIREWTKSGRLAAVKTSVTTERFAGGCSLTVTVKAAPFSVFRPGYLAACEADRGHHEGNTRYSDAMTEALATLNTIIDVYHRNDSDYMTDYFDVNFYKHVGVDFDLSQGERAAYKVTR